MEETSAALDSGSTENTADISENENKENKKSKRIKKAEKAKKSDKTAVAVVKQKKERRKLFKKPTKLEMFAFVLIVAAIVAVLWPFCTIQIEGGHVGVYYSTFFGGTQTDVIYNEGLRFVAPWDKMISYDSRVQSQSYHIDALAKGGLTVQVELTAVYQINRNEAGLLHKTIGPTYTEKLINPAVLSSVRSVVGNLTQTELYNADLLKIQSDVLEQISGIFKGRPLTITSVLIREIVFPESVRTAINEKFVAEQNVLEERYRVLQAVELYKETYVNAEATRFQQALVSEGMTEAFLRYLGIEATKELAQSDNAKLVIIGDKDGLPLILNPDSLTETVSTSDGGETYPDGLTVDDYRVTEGEQTRPDQFAENYDRIIAMLEGLSGIADDVSELFADAPIDIDTTIEQQGQLGSTDE
jgi:regulator of protease activity HflC (stomatin/prohibitin superfamily)